MYDVSPWEDEARIAAIGRLADEGDVGRLVDVLMLRAQDWHEGYGVASRLRAMPEEPRRALADRLVGHHNSPGGGPDQRERAVVLLALVADGFVEEAWCDYWVRMLEDRARHWYSTGTSDEVPAVAEAVLNAGRGLSWEVVGLLRRSAGQGLGWAGLLLDRLAEPLLNPGEPWADRILAELPVLGERWRDLVAYLVAPKAGRPTRRWEREAAGRIDGIGAEAVRRRVTPWLATAAQGGGQCDGGYDSYNVHVIIGLAWLMPLLPPYAETARVLGALVEHPPVKAGVAGAGVHALARLEGGAGRVELARLAGCVDHKVTLKQVRRALEV
jgi:hypothetical protein